MKSLMVFVLAVASLWDGFTTFFGTTSILGNEAPQIAAALVFTALILVFLLNTRSIFYYEVDFTGTLLKALWFVAFCYDIYTSWVGNHKFILQGEADGAELALLIGLTALVSGSPIILSLLWDEWR